MRLEFQSNEFREGLNMTVRKGSKWSAAQHANIDGVMTPILVRTVKFRDITDFDLMFEQNPRCRDKETLTKVMEGTYGGIEDDDDITLVYFMMETQAVEA